MNLEFFIRLKETVGSGLAKVADVARKTSAAIRNTNDTVVASYDSIKNKVKQLEEVISKSTSTKQIREARIELEKLNRLASNHPGNIGGSKGGFFAGLKSALPAFGIAGAIAMGGGALNQGLAQQARSTSFEVLAGKEQGGQLNKDLTKYAADSIYGNEVFKDAQTMLGFGIAVKDVMPNIRMLGDIAMGDAEKLNSLSLAFSQVKAAGRLMGQEVLQFINAGFNPLQQISKDTGISMADLKQKMSDGEISFEMVQKAIEHATGAGGLFYDMTNKIAQTDFGKWQAFQGQLEGLAMQFGGLIAPMFGYLITNVLAPLVNLLSQVVEWVKQNIEWIQPLAIAIGAATAAYWLYVSAVSAGTMATFLMTGAMKVLNLVMTLNPIGLVIAAIAALVAMAIYAWNNFEGFRATVLGLWEVLKVLWEYIQVAIMPIIILIKLQFLALKWVITSLWDVFKWVFTKIADFFAWVFQPIIDAIKWMFNAVANTKFGKSIAAAWNKGKNSATSSAATPASATLGEAAPGAKANNGNEAVKEIASGGPRVININGVKFTEKVEIHAATVRESAEELKKIFDEYLLRVLNSGAAVQ